MIVAFLPEARSEHLHAVEYYEGQLIGLGLRFWDEIDQHKFPEAQCVANKIGHRGSANAGHTLVRYRMFL